MYKKYYAQFLSHDRERLHFAAHSHHCWPDVTRDAHIACFDDGARLADEKWEKVFGAILPAAQQHAAKILNLPRPETIAFAPNTHEFVVRLFSCLEFDEPIRILTTDSEFHSFSRQAARLEEIEDVTIERIPVDPIDSFEDRFAEAASRGGHDLVFFSHVFFNSGMRVRDLARLVAAPPDPETLVVVDGYHAFCAFPVDIDPIRERAFYLAGGYKYAQAGEGVCLMHVPPAASQLRPAATGWFADFASLETGATSPVGYGPDAYRFWGSTFDPSGLYRFNAVMDWRESIGLTIEKSDDYVRNLQRRFLKAEIPILPKSALISEHLERIGHFLTYRLDNAGELCKKLKELKVISDFRGDRLRFGFGLYHDDRTIDSLVDRLKSL